MEFVIIKGQKYPINILIQNKVTTYVKLRHLTIKNSGIKSLTEIERIHDKNIESLNIGDQIRSLEGLECFSNLRSLSIGNQIAEIKYLESLPNLTDLHVYGTFSKIQPLNNPNLEVLRLEGNITKIDGLESLTNLKSLYLDNNSISEIENLKSLLNLHRLSLANNKITRIKNLDSLDLYNLNLEGNQISEIENLDSLKKLGSLNLSHNIISKIKGLDNLEMLSMLYLNENKVKKIQGFSRLKKLQEVHLDHNQIDSISGIETIKYGAKVVLQENPIPKDQLDCFRYHYEIYDHERGDEMGDILYQLAVNGRIKGLQDLLYEYEDEFEKKEMQIYENNEVYDQVNSIDKKDLYQLELERFNSRSYAWKFIGERIEDEFGKMKKLALDFSEASRQATLLIKKLNFLKRETLDANILKSVFLLQARLFIKRGMFYHSNSNNEKRLTEMRPFFLSWDKKFGRFYFEPLLEGVEIRWNHCRSCGKEIIDGKYCYPCLLDHPILAVPQEMKEEFKLPQVQESLKKEQIFDSLLYKNTISGLQEEIELCFRDFNEEQRKRMRESFLAFLQAYLYSYKQEGHSRNLKLREFED